MLDRTDHPAAPWVLAEAGDKRWARVQVAGSVVAAIEAGPEMPFERVWLLRSGHPGVRGGWCPWCARPPTLTTAMSHCGAQGTQIINPQGCQ